MLSASSQFSIDLYELIRSKTDEATAKKAVESVEGIIETKHNGLATKEDITNLKLDLKTELSAMYKWFLASFILVVVMILGLYFK